MSPPEVEEHAKQQTRNLLQSGFILGLFSDAGILRQHVPPKRQPTFNGIHGVIFHKIGLLITIAVLQLNTVFIGVVLGSSMLWDRVPMRCVVSSIISPVAFH
jgi:hypothetical protein